LVAELLGCAFIGARQGSVYLGRGRPTSTIVCMTFIQPFVSKGFPLVRFSGPYTVVASSCQMLKILP
jgi:hypothetical protein